MLGEDKFSCIKKLTKTVHITLAAIYVSNEIAGVTTVLESWKRQYNQQLEGIVVSYKIISVACRSGSVLSVKPFMKYDVEVAFELFCPSIGSIVKGKVNRVSHDYIGCLVHNTINVTVKHSSSGLGGLSKMIALECMILFQVTCFVYKRKVIRVKGEITEECVRLMKELTPFNTQSGIFKDSPSSYFLTAELTEDNTSNVKDNENTELDSDSLIAPNYSFQTTNPRIFNVDHLADRTSESVNDFPSTSHESDSSEELNTDLNKKSERHYLHEMFTMSSEEDMDSDNPISDFKPSKKHKDKKSKDKSFNRTKLHENSTYSEPHQKSPSKKKKSKKDNALNDSAFDTASSIEAFDGLKVPLSALKKKSSKKSLLNTSKLGEFSSPEQNAVNPVDTISSNCFNTDFLIKEEISTDSSNHTPSPKKKSKNISTDSSNRTPSPKKKSKNISLDGHLASAVTDDINDNMMNIFAASELKLEDQLHNNSNAIKQPIEIIKKKRKRELLGEDGLPLKKKKKERDSNTLGKSKNKLKKGKSKKKDKDKSKKDKKKKSKDKKLKSKKADKKLKSKKAQLSYKIKSKKDKKKKEHSKTKKHKKSSNIKTEDVP